MSELRIAFVHAVRTAGRSASRAAKDFGTSRKTAYTWRARFDGQQPMGDHSRRPRHSPSRTSEALEAAVPVVRDRYGWGPRKIRARLTDNQQPAPPVRTIADILRRHQRIKPAAPRPADGPRSERPAPNELGQLDFKGRIGIARQKVSPLTIPDDHSRFLLALRPCTDLTTRTDRNVLWDAPGEYGLPDAIPCDNAFGARSGPTSRGVSGFESRLLRVGIRPIHGRP